MKLAELVSSVCKSRCMPAKGFGSELHTCAAWVTQCVCKRMGAAVALTICIMHVGGLCACAGAVIMLLRRQAAVGILLCGLSCGAPGAACCTQPATSVLGEWLGLTFAGVSCCMCAVPVTCVTAAVAKLGLS